MTQPLRDALQALLGPGFQLGRELSGGGMSRVFVAHEPALKRDVVVKVLPSDLFSRKSAERFQREVEVTAQLQHPHILPVVTAGGSDRIRYYVVPFIAGGSLRERLASHERLSLDAGLSLASELLTAVAFAHDRGILHRDIRPGNVLLADGHAVLADFGIAQALEAEQAEDAGVNTSVAPPEAYLAPERPTNAAADLYAVAVLTHELLVGSLPQAGAGVDSINAALRNAHANADRQRLRAIAVVLAQALSVTPARRFPSAEALRSALHQAGQPRRSQYFWVGVAATAVFGVLAFSEGRTPRVQAPIVSAAQGTALALDTISVPDAVEETDEAAPAAAAPVTPSPRERALRQLGLALPDAWYWSGVRQERATQAALEALKFRDSLSRNDVLLADGIVALGRRQYPRACEAFDAARREQESFAAWMGSAECRTRDSLVVIDASGAPAFRSSWFTAARAYREAGRLGSRAEIEMAYSRLPHVLFTDASRVRLGVTTDGRVVMGQALATGDTIAFEAAAPGQRRRTPESIAATARAIELARDLLRPALVSWTIADSSSVRARELLAELLEDAGNVRDAGADGLTALAIIQSARALPASDEIMLRLARSEARLRLRSGEFAAAARIADSTLAHNQSVSNSGAETLLSLAMLTGKAQRATALLEQVSGGPGRQLQLGQGRVINVPPSAHRARAEFVVNSTLGLCNEAVRSAPARLTAMVDAMFPSGQRPPGAEGAFLERPLMLALPCVGLDGIRALREPTNPIARALHAPGDDAIDRAIGVIEARQRASQQSGGPGFVSTEMVLSAAHLYLLRADTAAAAAALAVALDALPLMPRVFVHSELLAGSLPRVMALHAELAAAQGEAEAAQFWARGAAALWANADDDLQPQVQRVTALSGSALAPQPR